MENLTLTLEDPKFLFSAQGKHLEKRLFLTFIGAIQCLNGCSPAKCKRGLTTSPPVSVHLEKPQKLAPRRPATRPETPNALPPCSDGKPEAPHWAGGSAGNMDFRVLGGGGGGLLSCLTGRGGVCCGTKWRQMCGQTEQRVGGAKLYL